MKVRGFQLRILAFPSAGKRAPSMASPHRFSGSAAFRPEKCSATLAFRRCGSSTATRFGRRGEGPRCRARKAADRTQRRSALRLLNDKF
jgi:hypothetical protein